MFLRIIESALGEDHVELADVLLNVGVIGKQRNDYIFARKHLEWGQRIIKDKLGSNHPKYTAFTKVLEQIPIVGN